MPYVATGGKSGRPRKYPEGMSKVEIRQLQREAAKAGAAVPAPVAAAPPPVTATTTKPPPPTPAGAAPAVNPAAAATKAAATMGLPAAGPVPGVTPPPPPLTAAAKEEFCLQRIGFVKASSAWLMAKRYGIDTERTPLPRGAVELSEPLTNEIKLNAEFLYPYLSAVSGPWALAAAAVFEVVGMIGALKETAKKAGVKPPEKKPEQKRPVVPDVTKEEMPGGWAAAGAPAPAAVMPG